MGHHITDGVRLSPVLLSHCSALVRSSQRSPLSRIVSHPPTRGGTVEKLPKRGSCLCPLSPTIPYVTLGRETSKRIARELSDFAGHFPLVTWNSANDAQEV